MENKELLTLAGRLNLPEAVLAPLAAAAKALPEGLPVGQLTEPEAAAAAWKTINAQLPVWQEDNGMAQLAVMLAAVCQAEERYHREGTPEDVFLPTMDCFRRFLEETHARTGQWAFDRGFWTWRQAAGLLFRLGTLEFEYRRMRPGPRPEGLEAEAPVLSVHIPSDAVLERKELDTSYNIKVSIHSTLDNLGELLRLDQVRPAIDGNLLRNQLLQKFHRKVFLLHVGDFFQKFRVKKRKLCSDIREKIDDTFAFDALLQKFVDSLIHFRKGKFLACSPGL